MTNGITEFLRGPTGGYELTRGLGALGGVVYVVTSTAIAFMTGASLTEYCLQMPVGLAAIMGAVAAGARWKDKGAAAAKAIERAGE